MKNGKDRISVRMQNAMRRKSVHGKRTMCIENASTDPGTLWSIYRGLKEKEGKKNGWNV